MPSISITKQRHILDMIQSAAQNSVRREDYVNGLTGDVEYNNELCSHRHLLCMGAWIALGEATPPAWQINIASGRTDRMFEPTGTAKPGQNVPSPQRNVLGTNTAPSKHPFLPADKDPYVCGVCGEPQRNPRHQG